MKNLLPLMVVLFILATRLFAADSGAPTKDNGGDSQTAVVPSSTEVLGSAPAEQDWKSIQELFRERSKQPQNWDGMTPSEQLLHYESIHLHFQALVLSFHEKYPTDPRRWEAVSLLKPTLPRFIKEVKPTYNQTRAASDLIIDDEAKSLRKRQIAELEAAMATASDLPPAVQRSLVYRSLKQELSAAGEPGYAGDWNALEQKVDAFAVESPDDKQRWFLELYYLDALEANKPAEIEARLRKSLKSPHPKVRTLAEARLRVLAARQTPLEMTFTAIDGRVVDLSALRGKVVLIDFWATWCHPCVTELPNLKASYDKFHDRGLEIIGISLDHRSDPQKLLDFVRTEKMPWSQYLIEGTKVDFAEEYGVYRIPETFLLDQTGKIVATSVRGRRLNGELERLLGPAEKAMAP